MTTTREAGDQGLFPWLEWRTRQHMLTHEQRLHSERAIEAWRWLQIPINRRLPRNPKWLR